MVTTWTCPLNPAHKFTGDDAAWILYLNHFAASHTAQQAAFTVLPGSQPYALYFNISNIFGKTTQIDWITGAVSWYSKSGTYAYHFYLAYFKGYGDRVASPSKMRDFHGIAGVSGTFQLGLLPSEPISGRPGNRIDLDRVLQDVLISAYPATQGDDYLTKADIVIKGWV